MELIITKFAELTNRSLTSPCAIVGKNGAGKSSIFNAYLWALTGKDKFGNEMNEAVYSDNDKGKDRYACVEVKFENVTFKRECRPVYARKAGTTESTLKALCSMDYYLNGVKCKKSEYEFEVARLCAGKDFRLFSDINYFANLKQAEQLEIFMSLLNINRDDYFKGMREVKTIKSEIADLKKDIKSRENWLDEEKRNFAQLEVPADYSEQITAKKDEISKIQSQRPTLTAEQIAENNEISKKIAELQNYTYKTISSEKRKILQEKRDAFNSELNNRNDLVRIKMQAEKDLAQAEKKLKEWEDGCEMPSDLPELVEVEKKITKFERLRQKDIELLENYEEANKNASCGLCPHCTDIFCEHRKTDLPTQDDLRREIMKYENDIAGLRAQTCEISEEWEKDMNIVRANILAEIEDLKKNMPNIAEADKRLETARQAVELAEIEAEKEKQDNETLATENEQKRRENETKIAELKAKIHIAQTATDDNRIYTLKIELNDLENKQRKSDEQRGHRKGVADSIERQQEKMSEITLKQADLERELIDWENADAKYRKDIQTKANEILPDGMSVNLFRPLITGDGFESVFELKYTDKKYKNTALLIKGNFDLTRMFQHQFGVSLPIFVDDLANVTDEEFIPKGENIIQIVAVAAQPLEIVPLLN